MARDDTELSDKPTYFLERYKINECPIRKCQKLTFHYKYFLDLKKLCVYEYGLFDFVLRCTLIYNLRVNHTTRTIT